MIQCGQVPAIFGHVGDGVNTTYKQFPQVVGVSYPARKSTANANYCDRFDRIYVNFRRFKYVECKPETATSIVSFCCNMCRIADDLLEPKFPMIGRRFRYR